MREPNPGTVKERLALIEEVMGPVLVELMAVKLLFRLLFEVEADFADEEDRTPLSVVLATALDELIDEIDDATEEPNELVRLQSRLAARAMLNVESGMVDVECEDEESPTNDNGPG
ncbi:hypothetical protein [Caulobacter sp. DWP3-1-3b2]|uniref:hypothetical protein n=1 Tax=Caulobacter sp. DWP3-1-3b2 TaxID=2804643 RepID=UPI003CEB81C6